MTALPGSGSVRLQPRCGCGPIARLLVLTMACGLGGWAIPGGLAAAMAGATRSAAAPVAAAANTDRAAAVAAADIRASVGTAAAAVFPLSVEPGARYLVDAPAGRSSFTATRLGP